MAFICAPVTLGKNLKYPLKLTLLTKLKDDGDGGFKIQVSSKDEVSIEKASD